MTFTRRQTLALISGTAASALAAPAIAQNRKITVGALRLTSHAASFVAEQRGYFAEAGLDAELRFFDAAQPMAVAIASGDVDFGITAMTGALISLADKGAVRIIGGALQEEPGIDGQKILASDAAFQAGITAPGMLDGKKWAVTQAGSSFHYMGSKIAAAEGIDLQYTPLQKVGAIIGAMKSGQVDGWSIVPHIAKALAGSGAVHIIGDVADYLPDYQVTTVFTSKKNTTDERAMTEEFLKVFSRGVDDFNAALVDKTEGDAGRDAMVELIHNYVYSDQPLEKAAPSIINGAMRLNANAALNMGSLRDQLDWFKAEDLVDDGIGIDTVVDDSFAPTMA
ncbi:ABC transporter substrate-binding protein [Oceaniglobus trochenteri]|uniref:ABC transporter substrate-binding protein n=1 Tax=Oceaniglobus trochenteri TaxID=2763260 RepID=UPI001CFFA662|nr:ABC transporter substrate-binding protein [Oceaniglobus trochenteri]